MPILRKWKRIIEDIFNLWDILRLSIKRLPMDATYIIFGIRSSENSGDIEKLV